MKAFFNLYSKRNCKTYISIKVKNVDLKPYTPPNSNQSPPVLVYAPFPTIFFDPINYAKNL